MINRDETHDSKDLKEKLDEFVKYLKSNFEFISLSLVIKDDNGFIHDIEETTEKRLCIVDIE